MSRAYTTPTTPPPEACPDCQGYVPPTSWGRLTETSPWVLCDPCPHCSRLAASERAAAEKARRLAHYQRTVPATYRPLEDQGFTDLRHPDWSIHRGGLQLAFLQRWRALNPPRPWAGIVGPAGHLKSRVLGVHARAVALGGSRLLWVNGANLGWASSTRADYTRKSQANTYLHGYRTHPGLLILDDLWKGNLDAPYFSALYAILEHRNAHRLPLLWSANTHPSDIASKIPPDLRDPIVGRLLENSHLLDLSQ